MKKLLLASLAIFALVACSKDNDDDGGEKSLNGTVWEYREATAKATWTFTSKTTVKYTTVISDKVETSYATYTYNPPSIIIDTGNGKIHGTINGNQMLLPLANDLMLVFTKQ